jgi:hypothetical protein
LAIQCNRLNAWTMLCARPRVTGCSVPASIHTWIGAGAEADILKTGSFQADVAPSFTYQVPFRTFSPLEQAEHGSPAVDEVLLLASQ